MGAHAKRKRSKQHKRSKQRAKKAAEQASSARLRKTKIKLTALGWAVGVLLATLNFEIAQLAYYAAQDNLQAAQANLHSPPARPAPLPAWPEVLVIEGDGPHQKPRYIVMQPPTQQLSHGPTARCARQIGSSMPQDHALSSQGRGGRFTANRSPSGHIARSARLGGSSTLPGLIYMNPAVQRDIQAALERQMSPRQGGWQGQESALYKLSACPESWRDEKAARKHEVDPCLTRAM